MGELAKFAGGNSRFIKLTSGSSFEGKYTGFGMGEYKGNTLIEYHYEIDGISKTFSSGSKRLALKMDVIPKDSHLKVTKYGAGVDTVYEVEVLSTGEIEQVASTVEALTTEKIKERNVDDW